MMNSAHRRLEESELLAGEPDAPSPFIRPGEAVDRLLERYPPPYLLAFSGGPDSHALCELLIRALRERASLFGQSSAVDTPGASKPCGWTSRSLVLAHVDHGLDGDSVGRARACERYARRQGLRLLTVRLEPAHELHGGLEAWARNQRYRALERLREANGANWILTAHHADDQVETLLMRMLAGSRIWGLAGIHGRNGRLLRPLLRVPRDELHAAASRRDARRLPAEEELPLRDPTNADLERTRNFIRDALHPHLADSGIERGTRELARRLTRISAACARLRRRKFVQLARAFDLEVGDGRRDSLEAGGWEESPMPLSALEHTVDVGPLTTVASVSLEPCFEISSRDGSPPRDEVTASPAHRCGDLETSRLELALEILHRSADAPPHRSSAFAELVRQLRRNRRARLDAGGGSVWSTQRRCDDLRLCIRRPAAADPPRA